MGEHKGWTIATLPTGKLLARVKTAEKGKYQSKSFPKDERRQATDWAKTEAAALRLGVSVGSQVRQCPTKKLVEDFSASLKGLGRAPSHTKDIERNLLRMAVAVPNLEAPSASAQIETWLSGLRSSVEELPDGSPAALAPATRNKVLAEARALCRWAMRKRRLLADPTAGIERAKVPWRTPSVFTLAELRTLLDESGDPYHRLFAVMVYTGLRVQEASGLHWEDVDWSGDCVVLRIRPGVRIKGQKERLVPLQPELRAILELPWPASRRRAIKTAPKVDTTPATQRKGAMFSGRRCNPYRGMANFLKRCDIELGDRSPHACRHTYGGIMSASGIPLSLLQSYMGHEDVSTTTIYTQLAIRYESTARNWPRGRMQIQQSAQQVSQGAVPAPGPGSEPAPGTPLLGQGASSVAQLVSQSDR